MNPLEDLLKNTLGELPALPSTPIKEIAQSETTIKTVESTENVSPTGEYTSTVKITTTTVRALRKRFMTNVPDELLAALIDRANADTFPKVQNASGQELESEIWYHQICANLLQNILTEHARIAYRAGAETKITRKEIEELRERRAQEKRDRIAREETAGKRIKKQIARAEAGDKLPLYDKLLRSADASQRGAGKFIKAQCGMGFTELQAAKMWNTTMGALNPAAIIKNIVGIPMDQVLEDLASGKGKK